MSDTEKRLNNGLKQIRRKIAYFASDKLIVANKQSYTEGVKDIFTAATKIVEEIDEFSENLDPVNKNEWDEKCTKILNEVKEHEDVILSKTHELDLLQQKEPDPAEKAKREAEELREKAKLDQKRKIVLVDIADLAKEIYLVKDIHNQEDDQIRKW